MGEQLNPELELPPGGRPLEARATVPWIIFVIFFAVLNETVFNVSTPAIARQYALTPSGVSWVMTTFIVFFGMGSVIYGRLSDLFSVRRLIVIGILTYAAGSAVGFTLQRFYPAVIAARAIQGAGASAIPALVMIVVARYFAPTDRGKVFGTITSTVALAAGLGPVIGGFVSGSLHWTFLFLIPLATLVSIPFFLRTLPTEPRRPGSIDVPGAVLVGLAVGALVLFLSFLAWYFLVACALALGAFLARILTARNPFIDPSLFRNRAFRAGTIMGFIVFCVSIGIIFVIPLMLSRLRGLSTREIGLVMFPGAISGVVFGTVGGTLADRRGNGLVIAIGLVALVGSLLAIDLLLGVSPWFTSAALLATYVGFSLIQTGLVNSVSLALEPHQTGTGMGLFNLVTFISGAVGTALVGRFLESRWLSRVPINPLAPDGDAAMYSNLLLGFALLAAVGAVVYFRSNGVRSNGVRARRPPPQKRHTKAPPV
jgi:DHA2 family metal-tetracycline-proton antiporter-like MFS transporter